MKEARDLVERWEALSASIKTQEHVVSGHFKIGCHPSVAIYSLPAFLKGLLSQHRRLEISLHHGRSRDIANDVIEWRLDFGLVINPPSHPDLVIKELARDEIALWVSKDTHLTDTLIIESGLFQTQNILKQLEKKRVKFARILESSSLEVIQTLTSSGCGVGILPTRVARSEEAKLKRFSSSAPTFEDRLCLIYRIGHQKQISSRAIIDSIIHAKI